MTIAPAIAFQIEEIRIHLSAGGAATNLTIALDAGAGVAYDCVLATQDMTGVTDLVYQPAKPILCQANDEVDIAYANGGGATYGIEVYYSAI